MHLNALCSFEFKSSSIFTYFFKNINHQFKQLCTYIDLCVHICTVGEKKELFLFISIQIIVQK